MPSAFVLLAATSNAVEVFTCELGWQPTIDTRGKPAAGLIPSPATCVPCGRGETATQRRFARRFGPCQRAFARHWQVRMARTANGAIGVRMGLTKTPQGRRLANHAPGSGAVSTKQPMIRAALTCVAGSGFCCSVLFVAVMDAVCVASVPSRRMV